MKQFNLEQALAGDPVCTEEGKEVTCLTEFKGVTCSDYNLVGICDGYISVWKQDGSSHCFGKNLKMKPKKVTKWVSVTYNKSNDSYYTFAVPSDSLEQAMNNYSGDVSHHMIEFEI